MFQLAVGTETLRLHIGGTLHMEISSIIEMDTLLRESIRCMWSFLWTLTKTNPSLAVFLGFCVLAPFVKSSKKHRHR